MPARYISIAAPDRRECVPISSGSKPSRALPMVAHAARRDVITWREVICSRQSWCQTEQTGVFSVVPWYDQIRLTRSAHCLTQHKNGSSVWPWMIVSCFCSFSCISNVTATLSANSKLADGVESRCPSLKNLILRRQSSFVRFISLWGTFKYSQERQVKKPAQIVSCKTPLSSSDTCLFDNSSRTMKGRC
jgi:hypothetical protein